jgi:hypothetical protein
MPTGRNPNQNVNYTAKMPTKNPLQTLEKKHNLHANSKSQQNNFIWSRDNHHEWRDKSQHTYEKNSRKLKSTTIFLPKAEHN